MPKFDSVRSVARAARPSLAELDALHAVIDTGKTTAAARQLGVTQSAISRAVAGLEARLGTLLFLRQGGRLVPTERAFALNEEARPIFSALARLGREERPRRLRIIAPPTIAHLLIAPSVARFRAHEPDIDVLLEAGLALEPVWAVADGTADVGLYESSVAHAGVEAVPFRRSTTCVLLPREHRLAALPRITPTDLGDEPLMAVTRRFSSRARLEQAFRQQGLTPRIALEASTLAVLLELVRSGGGIAVVNPFPIAANLPDGLLLRPFWPAIPHVAHLLFAPGSRDDSLPRRFGDFLRADTARLCRTDGDDEHGQP